MKQGEHNPGAAKLWVYNPPLDLIVGCGAWSAPLLLLAYFSGVSATMTWAVALYVLALFFNYPHYMATLYRAYHTSEDFNKYRVFTVHITGLVLATVFLSHLYPRLLPWIFTLYLTWSPWHYSGQNYGLFMMFARRAGASPSPMQRRALFASFLISYAILFVSMYSGPSSDPLFISPGMADSLVRAATAVLGVAFTVVIVYGVSGLLRQVGVRRLMPALTLLSTQGLWFLLPSFLWLAEGWRLPASRYSTGVLAIMHSAQYLWITSYYAKREATGAGAGSWRPFAYLGVLIAGGIALFIPGPWLASYVFHYDFTTSFLIFTALVNLHHFILDGAIWKLRDGRIASLLLHSRQQVAAAAGNTGGWIASKARWFAGDTGQARALRISLAVALVALASVDRVRFLLTSGEGNLARVEKAVSLNRYDSTAEMQLAKLELQAGKADAAIAAWKRAIAARPSDPVPRNGLLQYLTDAQRFQEAYELAHAALQRSPRDADLLVNYGLLAEKLGHREEAIASWQRALRVDPGQARAHVYLATSLDHQGKFDDAIPEYVMFLDRVAHSGAGNRPPVGEIIPIVLQLAECQAHAARPGDALRSFDLATKIARQAGDKKLESLAEVREAEFDIKQGDTKDAIRLYQQALKLDIGLNDPRNEAVDLYNYGLLLRRAGHSESLVYACLSRTQALLQSTPPGPEAQVVAIELKKMEAGRSSKSPFASEHSSSEAALREALAVQ